MFGLLILLLLQQEEYQQILQDIAVTGERGLALYTADFAGPLTLLLQPGQRLPGLKVTQIQSALIQASGLGSRQRACAACPSARTR
ncbi:hypothetical protein M2158_004641 [Streptomyces sp. SAI-144]|uniref:hypothetical protein n=1 Tax=Streptomyces sp. SAI-144 TaxID=2940544 RepID=UPI002475E6EA|nr:hypothetical protein [Streptomyces sp. SAI-144]MDH6436101.1 hypothetical protein [Streptomyces sp. SAI-144]